MDYAVGPFRIRIDKGEQAAIAGAVGMVLANDLSTGNDIVADPHVLPASHVNYSNGLAIFSYINSTKKPIAYITPPKTQLGTKPAPLVAAFSSKGPNSITPEILKADITAPGVSVIAAYTEAQESIDLGLTTRRVEFTLMSGTSISCPHVAGIVGLLKNLYPHWSLAAIKSAILTSANTRANNMEPILDASNTKANPFNYGAGHIRPNKAMDPDLIYDLTIQDYLNFLCAIGYNDTQISSFTQDGTYKCILSNFNYPSITIPNFNVSMTITRAVTNVGSPSTYKAKVKNPNGVFVSVEPEELVFRKDGEVKNYRVVFNGGKMAKRGKDYVFGKLVWEDGKHKVKSTIVLKWSS